MKRMAVLSVALILLCVNGVAQNEEKNKNVTNEVYPASLRDHIVRLKPTDFWSSQVILMQSYDRPYIVYKGRNYYPEEKVEGTLFTAEIFDNGNNTYGFEITAKEYNKTITYEVLYIQAIRKSMLFSSNKNTAQNLGFPFRIEVYK